jgi:hypothetical protein
MSVVESLLAASAAQRRAHSGRVATPGAHRPPRHAGRAQAASWRRAVLPNPTPIIFIEVLTKCQYRLKLKFAISE